jgi:two-component system CheB/CheR fusion protein
MAREVMAEFPIVGIGSSAGGLEALQTLLRGTPADSGLAFIIAAHLDPTQKSHLAELLSRCTQMPVVQIKNAVKVEPDHVYVIAPDQELTIRKGVVRGNRPTAPRGHRHPVDSFFRSLAEDQGERAIAIILSGTGSNGSLGLRFIKAEGAASCSHRTPARPHSRACRRARSAPASSTWSCRRIRCRMLCWISPVNPTCGSRPKR